MTTIALLFLGFFVLEVRRAMKNEQKAIELIVEQRALGPIKPDYVIMLLALAQHARYQQILADVDSPLKLVGLYLYLYFTRYDMSERAASKLIYRLHHKEVLRLDTRTQNFYLK